MPDNKDTSKVDTTIDNNYAPFVEKITALEGEIATLRSSLKEVVDFNRALLNRPIQTSDIKPDDVTELAKKKFAEMLKGE